MALLAALKSAGGAVNSSTKGKSPHPTFTGLEQEAERWLAAKRAADAADAEVELARLALTDPALDRWFESQQGLTTTAGSIVIAGNGSGQNVLVSFAAVWKGGLDTLPPDCRRDKANITIDGDSIPAATADRFAAGLLALARECVCEAAVKIKAVEGYPVADFNVRRHSLFTPAQNLALEGQGLGTRITLRVK